MITVTIRGFSYFKIFSHFSYIVEMFISMIKNSLGVLFVIIYFFLCLSSTIAKTLEENEGYFKHYFMMFGL